MWGGWPLVDGGGLLVAWHMVRLHFLLFCSLSSMEWNSGAHLM